METKERVQAVIKCVCVCVCGNSGWLQTGVEGRHKITLLSPPRIMIDDLKCTSTLCHVSTFVGFIMYSLSQQNGYLETHQQCILHCNLISL